jgi:hypothetical protein
MFTFCQKTKEQCTQKDHLYMCIIRKKIRQMEGYGDTTNGV